jgi:ribonuclease P protein component
VVHLVPCGSDATSPENRAVRVGFVVGRAVGGSVVRHRVRRRLRHLCLERLSALPAGTELVVRALPPSARATYQELGADLDRCLERALGDHGPKPGAVS